MANYIEFSELLAQHLGVQDRTQSWLAHQINVSRNTVSRWLYGNSQPRNPELIIQIADVLNIRSRNERLELLAAAGYENFAKTLVGHETRFGELLHEFRNRIPLSSENLGELIGLSASYVNNVEAGESKITRDKLKDMIRALHQLGGIHTLVEANELLSESTYDNLNIDEIRDINSGWLTEEQPKNDEKKIIRSIDFPPEYKQAGISILSYFSEVVSSKYPDLEVGVTIEQIGTMVTLVVTTPEGEKERIEQELQEYSLVVQGKSPPESYFHSSNEVLALQNKLEIAALEIRQTTRLLKSERQHYKARIESLEQQVQWMGSLVDKDRTAHTELINSIRDLSRQANTTTRHSFKTILDILERGIEAEDSTEIVEALSNIQREDRSLFQQVSELITIGAIQGVAGNYLYQFLLNLSLRLP